MAKAVNSETFEATVLKADKPVLVDFYADWCGPCKMMAPILEKWAQANAGKAEVVKLDVDSATDLASQYGVMSIPTLVLFNGGKEVARAVGLQNEKALDNLLTKAQK